MNAVQIIHKHVMLRFCVLLLAVFVASGAFASTCFADEPLSRQITVAVGNDIGNTLGSLAGGAISAAGVSAVGLPALALPAAGLGGHLGGDAGGVVGGLFAGKLYDFLTGYGGDANEDSFETAYDSWSYDNCSNLPNGLVSGYDLFCRTVETFSASPSSSLLFLLSSSTGSIFSFSAVIPTYSSNSKQLIFTLDYPVVYAPYYGKFSDFFGYELITCSDNKSLNRCPSEFITDPSSLGFVHFSYGSLMFKSCTRELGSAGDYNYSSSAVTTDGIFYLYYFGKPDDEPASHNYSSYRAGSASSGVSVAKSLVSNIGGSSKTIGCIDASTPDEASNFYTIPLVDEDDKTLILPDGTTIAYDDVVYDYTTRTYYITYDTSKTYQITYNYDNCFVNNGTASNIYYYATVDANTPTYDKDGNQTGGSTTDPDNPDPSDPDKPSGDDDDDSGSIWDKVVDAIAGLFTAIGKVIGGLLESVINLFTGIVDGLTGCLDLFGSFGEFVAGFYTWMPEEWRTILAAAFTTFIGLAVVKLFRGS